MITEKTVDTTSENALENLTPHFLHTSFAGSYYEPCKIVSHDKDKKRLFIEYIDPWVNETCERDVGEDDIYFYVKVTETRSDMEPVSLEEIKELE